MAKRDPDSSVTAIREADILREILRGTATETGSSFFNALVTCLARALGTHMAWVTEYQPGEDSLNALALLAGDELRRNQPYRLRGTPCEPVICDARIVHHSEGARSIYPRDTELAQRGIESYLGVPLFDTNEKVLGHLAVMDTEPMPEDATALAILQIFASRAAAELQRMRAENEQQQLQQLLQRANAAVTESEQRFRDLFEEAPIAYVHEDLDTRFIRANRTALDTLGVKAEEVTETYGLSLVPDDPEAKERVEQALAAVRGGDVAEGTILELRRKDTGEPVWIRWWSSPAADGSFTRTMFIDITDHVMMSRQNRMLEAQNTYLQQELHSLHTDDFVGESQSMRCVIEDLHRVAQTDTTVLILGETGTGKELAARAVHTSSARSARPLIKVNCAALPAALIESELFGHEKGAFTGASKPRDGRFSLADGGTIFLDEIGELSLELQVKLLRVLQEGEFERLGSSRTRSVDVRVIAATNRNLRQAVRNGDFREDLYYRLAVFPIEMPPLRNRDDDVVQLARDLAERHAQRIGRAIAPLSEAHARRLKAYAWPGNVRELQNVIERAVITSTDGTLNLDRALPEVGTDDASAPSPSTVLTAAQMQQRERDNIVLALESCDWKVAGESGAARRLRMNPSTLSSRMKALGIRRPT